MRSRHPRTLIAVLAALGLVGALAVAPVVGQSATPTCVAGEPTTEEVTDGVTLTYDSDFTCTDADTTGSWSITVSVTNDSATEVTIEEIALSHATPPFGEEGDNTLDAHTLPLTLAGGETGTFDASGTYTLVETDEGELVNLHLRAGGTTAGEESAPFVLGINVHVLGPGVEPDDDEDGDGGAEGRPEWAPGPPPWVVELLWAIFEGNFPWGTDTFPPGADADAEAEAAESADADAGPPAWVPVPPPPASGEVPGDGDGPPAWVPVPPPPAGEGDEDEGDETDDGPPEWAPVPPAPGRP